MLAGARQTKESTAPKAEASPMTQNVRDEPEWQAAAASVYSDHPDYDLEWKP